MKPKTLTPRQRQIALLVSRGLRTKQIAQRLRIAENTVLSHRKAIYARTGATNPVLLSRMLNDLALRGWSQAAPGR